MLLVIFASIVPLMFANDYPAFRILDAVTTSLFIADYLLRWAVADLSEREHSPMSVAAGRGGHRSFSAFVLYPFSPMAVIDLLSILPGLNVLSPAFKVFRFIRVFRIVRLLKVFRYSSKITVFLRVLRKERAVLSSVLVLALFYIFLTALIMFNVEPRVNPETGEPTFADFFDALYWATVTLTTVGYGDLCPVTEMGRFISMLSSLFGVAIIALPSGVITASYMDELRRGKDDSAEAPSQD